MTGIGCNSVEGSLDSRELVLPPNLLQGEESRYMEYKTLCEKIIVVFVYAATGMRLLRYGVGYSFVWVYFMEVYLP